MCTCTHHALTNTNTLSLEVRGEFPPLPCESSCLQNNKSLVQAAPTKTSPPSTTGPCWALGSPPSPPGPYWGLLRTLPDLAVLVDGRETSTQVCLGTQAFPPDQTHHRQQSIHLQKTRVSQVKRGRMVYMRGRFTTSSCVCLSAQMTPPPHPVCE